MCSVFTILKCLKWKCDLKCVLFPTIKRDRCAMCVRFDQNQLIDVRMCDSCCFPCFIFQSVRCFGQCTQIDFYFQNECAKFRMMKNLLLRKDQWVSVSKTNELWWSNSGTDLFCSLNENVPIFFLWNDGMHDDCHSDLVAFMRSIFKQLNELCHIRSIVARLFNNHISMEKVNCSDFFSSFILTTKNVH